MNKRKSRNVHKKVITWERIPKFLMCFPSDYISDDNDQVLLQGFLQPKLMVSNSNSHLAGAGNQSAKA